MVAGNDLVNLQLRGFVQSARPRLVVDERNHIRSDAHVSGTKIFVHHAERHIALQILVHVVAMADARQRANHFKADAVEQNSRADRRTSQKHGAPRLIPQHDHRTFLLIVHIVDPAPFMHG